MIALSGVGLLFMYLIKHPSRAYNVVLLLAILPIAFLANIVRVMLLMLVTYHFGDGAGQAFHDYAGYLEIVFAFGAFFAFDAIVSPLFRRRGTGTTVELKA
jgi:exosortase/archaeosortase family protein